MRIPQSYIQKCKVVAHVLQALLIFIGGCLALAVLTKSGTSGGATKYYFALCFLTIPALVYLTMVPMWSRAVKFANAYAFVAVDALYTICCFSSFIAVALWNSAGIRQGAKDRKVDTNKGNCSTFAYGSDTKCSISRATFGFGVVIWILFAITTSISAYYMIKFRKEGLMPYESSKTDPHHLGGSSSPTATKPDNSWSADPHDDEDDDTRTERGGNQEEDEYALLHSTETEEGRHPGRPLSWGEDRYHAEPAPPYAGYDSGNADALSPGGYEDYRREAGAAGGAGGRESGYEDFRTEAPPAGHASAPYEEYGGAGHVEMPYEDYRREAQGTGQGAGYSFSR